MLLIKISHDHPLKISRACAMTFHDEFPKFSWNHQFFFVCLWSGIASVLLFIPESWYFSHSLIVLWAKTIVMIICYLIFRTKTVLKSEKKTSLIHGCIINNNMLSLTLATQQNKSIGRGKQQQKISYKNKTKTLIFSHKKELDLSIVDQSEWCVCVSVSLNKFFLSSINFSWECFLLVRICRYQ